MTTVIERFKKRKALSSVVDVPFPSAETPEIIFKVGRPAPVEMRGIVGDAIVSRSIDSTYTEKMLGVIKRHLKDWSGVDMPYSEDEAAQLFDQFEFTELMILVSNFTQALKDDEAAKLGNS